MAPRGESPAECGVAQVLSASPSANPVGVRPARFRSCRSIVLSFPTWLLQAASLAAVASARPHRVGSPCSRSPIAAAPRGPRRLRRDPRRTRRRRRRVQRALGITADGVLGPRRAAPCGASSAPTGCPSTASSGRDARGARAAASRPPARRERRTCWSGSPSASPAATRRRCRPTAATAASTSSPRDLARAGRQGRSGQGARGASRTACGGAARAARHLAWPNCAYVTRPRSAQAASDAAGGAAPERGAGAVASAPPQRAARRASAAAARARRRRRRRGRPC